MSHLDYKIYSGKTMRAAVDGAALAARLCAIIPDAVVRYGGRIVWKEGKETFTATQKPEQAAMEMITRRKAHAQAALARVTGAVRATGSPELEAAFDILLPKKSP